MPNLFTLVRPGVWTLSSIEPVEPVLVNGYMPWWVDDEPIEYVDDWKVRD